jgi:hypothetical protein
METSPLCSVRDKADQALRRPPTESRLNVLLSKARHLHQWSDPANAMGIFPKELRRAQFPVPLIRVCLAKTLNIRMVSLLSVVVSLVVMLISYVAAPRCRKLIILVYPIKQFAGVNAVMVPSEGRIHLQPKCLGG